MGQHAPEINLCGVMLDRAGVMAALHERAARLAGELDRMRIDCDMPSLADTLSLAARELHNHTITALDDRAAAPNVVPELFSALDALIRDLAMVESSEVADDGFPTNAQGRTLLRYLHTAFSDEAHLGERGAHISRGAGSAVNVLLVRSTDGSTSGIDPEGRLST